MKATTLPRLRVALTLSAVLLVALGPAMPLAQAAATTTVPLGMDTASIDELRSNGAPPGLASFWVGHWMVSSGWGGLDNALAAARDKGVTPVVYWYYWGDSITPNCVDYGCDGRSRAQWDSMTTTLADHIRNVMGGRRVIVVLENEFNKGGIDSSTYAPKFDGYLSAKATQLNSVAGVDTVIGYGAWGEENWGRFPKTLAATDYVGFQMMRGSTRDSEATYRGAPDKIASVLTKVKSLAPGKGALLYDLALSSYPDSTYLKVQGETMSALVARLPEYAGNGLAGIVYRELHDNPSMSPANYFGYAEQHWGLKTATSDKAAWIAWKSAYSTSALSIPGSFEAEAMKASTGGLQNDASASGGALWNVWSNGDLSQSVASPGGWFRVAIVAKGTPAQGVYPTMELRVDGARVASWSVTGSLATYRADAQIASGARTISVAFTNDLYAPPEDRNLLVDLVTVAKNAAPAASFTASVANLVASVDASATTDADGDALTYAWSWGDGTSGSGRTSSHTYGAGGTYTITLTASDGKASATATRSVTVSSGNRAPSPSFSASGSGLAWSFDASASADPDGDALTYAWSFGDGATATGRTASRTYGAPGSYTVTLTVSDGKASASTSKVVTATQAFAASFAPHEGNEWWIQTKVSANLPLASVCAAVNGGACRPLTLRSWGSWAESYHAPTGSTVVFTATSSDGQKATSVPYAWPYPPPVAPFTAKFTPYGGSTWWVQAKVEGSESVKAVCASINGGACQRLTYRSWDAWAESYKAGPGSKVVFTATGESGRTVTSSAYTWPVK